VGSSNRTNLVALSGREYRRQAGLPDAAPAPERFRGMRIKLTRFDPSWDRKRGSAARLMGVLLRENDQQLQDRVCADGEATRTYTGAAAWLHGEAKYLRSIANLMEKAAGRLSVVLKRCGSAPPSGVTTSSTQS
jgi:hypothetical protein